MDYIWRPELYYTNTESEEDIKVHTKKHVWETKLPMLKLYTRLLHCRNDLNDLNGNLFLFYT